MDNRIAIKTAGALLIFQMSAAIISYSIILDPLLYGSTDFLRDIAINADKVRIAVLLDFSTTLAYLGAAILLFPFLKQVSERIAIWFVAIKASEFATYLVGAVFTLTILSISKGYVEVESSDGEAFRIMGKYMRSARIHMLNLNLLAYCFGTFFFFLLLFRSRLVPRFLSVWGMIAVFGVLTDIILSIFGYSTGVFMYVLMMPMGLCELFLGFWLIFKGLNIPVTKPQVNL